MEQPQSLITWFGRRMKTYLLGRRWKHRSGTVVASLRFWWPTSRLSHMPTYFLVTVADRQKYRHPAIKSIRPTIKKYKARRLQRRHSAAQAYKFPGTKDTIFVGSGDYTQSNDCHHYKLNLLSVFLSMITSRQNVYTLYTTHINFMTITLENLDRFFIILHCCKEEYFLLTYEKCPPHVNIVCTLPCKNKTLHFVLL